MYMFFRDYPSLHSDINKSKGTELDIVVLPFTITVAC
jgi:hypothetical protein